MEKISPETKKKNLTVSRGDRKFEEQWNEQENSWSRTPKTIYVERWENEKSAIELDRSIRTKQIALTGVIIFLSESHICALFRSKQTIREKKRNKI